MRVAEFAFEHSPLLFLYAPSRLKGKTDDPFEIGIGDWRARVRRKQLDEAAHGFAHGFDVAAGQRSPEMNATIEHIGAGQCAHSCPAFGKKIRNEAEMISKVAAGIELDDDALAELEAVMQLGPAFA
jgi:hypothetical protein